MRIVAASFAALLFASPAVLANEPPPPPPAPAAPPAKPSGLTGNALPKCLDGEYVAGMICKISPPDHYLEVGAKYPVRCPPGTRAPAGSKNKAYCR
jgi:hypothetical protein